MALPDSFFPAPVSLLYVPGHKTRARDEARGLAADMLIIDLEDAVPPDLKAEARAGAKAALEAGFPGKLAYDGVCNLIDDPESFSIDARDGYCLGFDGKTLIHPSQVDPCYAAFAPTPEARAAARTLVAAATGGTERHDGQMVEDMHAASARALIAREALRANRRSGIAQS